MDYLAVFVLFHEGYAFTRHRVKTTKNGASVTFRCRRRSKSSYTVVGCDAYVTISAKGVVSFKHTHTHASISDPRVVNDPMLDAFHVNRDFTRSLVDDIVQWSAHVPSLQSGQIHDYVHGRFKQEMFEVPLERYLHRVDRAVRDRLNYNVDRSRQLNELLISLRTLRCKFEVYPGGSEPVECVVWYDRKWPKPPKAQRPIRMLLLDGTCSMSDGRAGLGHAIVITAVDVTGASYLAGIALVTSEQHKLAAFALRFVAKNCLEHFSFPSYLVSMTDEHRGLISAVETELAHQCVVLAGCAWHRGENWSKHLDKKISALAADAAASDTARRDDSDWDDICCYCARGEDDGIKELLCCDAPDCHNSTCIDCAGGPLYPEEEPLPFLCVYCTGRADGLHEGRAHEMRAGLRAFGLRRSAKAFMNYVHEGPTIEISRARLEEVARRFGLEDSKFISNALQMLPLYAASCLCDKLTLDIKTNSSAELMNNRIKHKMLFAQKPAHAVPELVRSKLNAVRDRKSVRSTKEDSRKIRSSRKDPLHRSPNLSKLIHSYTLPEHAERVRHNLEAADSYAVTPVSNVSAAQAVKLQSTASGVKFLLGLSRASTPRLFGVSFAKYRELLPSDVYHQIVFVDEKRGFTACSCMAYMRLGTWCFHLWAVWNEGYIWFSLLHLLPDWLGGTARTVSRSMLAVHKCTSFRHNSLRADPPPDVADDIHFDTFVDLYRAEDPSWPTTSGALIWKSSLVTPGNECDGGGSGYGSCEDFGEHGVDDGLDESSNSDDSSDENLGGKRVIKRARTDLDEQVRGRRRRPRSQEDVARDLFHRAVGMARRSKFVKEKLKLALHDVLDAAQKESDDIFARHQRAVEVHKHGGPPHTRPSPAVKTDSTRKPKFVDMKRRGAAAKNQEQKRPDASAKKPRERRNRSARNKDDFE